MFHVYIICNTEFQDRFNPVVIAYQLITDGLPSSNVNVAYTLSVYSKIHFTELYCITLATVYFRAECSLAVML